MRYQRHIVLVFAASALLIAAGCGKKKAPVAVPSAPATAPKPVETTIPPPALSPAQQTEPAQLPAPSPTRPMPPIVGEPPPPASSERPKSSSPPKSGRPAEPGPYTPQGPVRAPENEGEASNPETPKYQLGQLLSPEQQQQYQQRIDAALKRARGSLRAARRPLDREPAGNLPPRGKLHPAGRTTPPHRFGAGIQFCGAGRPAGSGSIAELPISQQAATPSHRATNTTRER